MGFLNLREVECSRADLLHSPADVKDRSGISEAPDVNVLIFHIRFGIKLVLG